MNNASMSMSIIRYLDYLNITRIYLVNRRGAKRTQLINTSVGLT